MSSSVLEIKEKILKQVKDQDDIEVAILNKSLSGLYSNLEVKKIRGSAFKNQTNLTCVELFQCQEIGASAFSGCSKLKTLILRNSTPPILADLNAFSGTSISKIYVPADSGDVYVSDSNWSSYADYIYGYEGSEYHNAPFNFYINDTLFTSEPPRLTWIQHIQRDSWKMKYDANYVYFDNKKVLQNGQAVSPNDFITSYPKYTT